MVTELKFNSVELESIEIATILSVPFCPYHFVRTISSNPILSGHRRLPCHDGGDGDGGICDGRE